MNNTSGINPKDLTKETYYVYCRLYLIQKIHDVIPISSLIEYRHIATLINGIDPFLFMNLHIETNKILLLNHIYSMFMSLNAELSKEFLYDIMVHLASYYNPEW